MKAFGIWLNTRLKKHNIKKIHLARSIGVNESTVHRWLSGNCNPNVLQWNGIAYFLALETNAQLQL
ncbi:MAG: XRE family transcriptional regulator [Marivivens sp.]|nr:XRE family transcriptional regulator [Marivivens sp.]